MTKGNPGKPRAIGPRQIKGLQRRIKRLNELRAKSNRSNPWSDPKSRRALIRGIRRAARARLTDHLTNLAASLDAAAPHYPHASPTPEWLGMTATKGRQHAKGTTESSA